MVYISRFGLILSWALFVPWTNEVISTFIEIGPVLQFGICVLAFIGTLFLAAWRYEDGMNETFLVPLSIFCMTLFYVTWKALPSWAAIIAPRKGVLVWYLIAWGFRLIDVHYQRFIPGLRKLKFHLFSR